MDYFSENKNGDIESQIEKLETNMYQMERKNTYIKTMLKNFIDMAKSYKIIDNELTGIQSKLSKNIQDIKDISFAVVFVYKFVTISIFIFFILLGLSGEKPAFYLYFFFENLFFMSLFFEAKNQIKERNIFFEPEESSSVKESREKINVMNTAQNYIKELIE